MSKARQLADLGNQVDDGAITGSNMVVNGAMTVAQRGVSFDPQGTGTGEGYTVDRFAWVRREETGSGFTFDATIAQDTDAPSHFDKSLKVVADAAQTLSGSENAMITTKFEGQTLQQFGWGSSDAKPLTLSFWVKSNKIGTYCIQTRYNNHSDSGLFEYSVDASSTWEYKTIIIPANTSVSFNSNNTLEMELMFHLAAGSSDIASASSSTGTAFFRVTSNQVNFFDATSNAWQITGVCLNVGDSAIDFPHESYGETLAKCQRYTYIISGAGYTPATDSAYARYFMFGTGSTSAKWLAPLPVPMRSTPSLITNNFTSSTVQVYSYTDDAAKTLSSISLAEGGIYQSQVNFTVSGSGLGDTLTWRWNNSPAAYIGFEAEL